MSTDFSWRSPEERPTENGSYFVLVDGVGNRPVVTTANWSNGEWVFFPKPRGWMPPSALAALPVAAPPKRVCKTCGHETDKPNCNGDCSDALTCIVNQRSNAERDRDAAVARAEKAERERDTLQMKWEEISERAIALQSERDAARRELGAVETVMQRLVVAINDKLGTEATKALMVKIGVKVIEAPYLSPAAESAGNEQPLGDGRG